MRYNDTYIYWYHINMESITKVEILNWKLHHIQKIIYNEALIENMIINELVVYIPKMLKKIKVNYLYDKYVRIVREALVPDSLKFIYEKPE